VSNFEENRETKQSQSDWFHFREVLDFAFVVVFKERDFDERFSQSVIFEEKFSFKKSSFESFYSVKQTVFAFFVLFFKSRTSN